MNSIVWYERVRENRKFTSVQREESKSSISLIHSSTHPHFHATNQTAEFTSLRALWTLLLDGAFSSREKFSSGGKSGTCTKKEDTASSLPQFRPSFVSCYLLQCCTASLELFQRSSTMSQASASSSSSPTPSGSAPPTANSAGNTVQV